MNLMEGYGGDNPSAKSQGMKQLMACAVYLHGAAADRAAAALGEYGMLPHDILSQLGRIFAENHR